MYVVLPEEYTVQKFHQLAGYVRFKRSSNVYEGGCPVCREGKSWGRKRRLYYVVKDSLIYCHNCGWSGNPIKFIQAVENLPYDEIVEEAENFDLLPEDISRDEPDNTPQYPTEPLPKDSINLLDTAQMDYYKDSEIVKRVYDLANERKLLTAVNRPKTLWVSLVDYVHKNRLVLPFYDSSGNIEFYQTRTVIPSPKLPKYLSKMNSEKTLFNLDNVSPDIDSLFLFEGPIDACFVKNGIAVAGIQENSNTSLTRRQQEQLDEFPLFDKIWVLDSQWQDHTSKTKTMKLAEQGHSVFVWPENYGKRFKDFNDMAVGLGINEIPYKFILDNTHTGLKVNLLLNVP